MGPKAASAAATCEPRYLHYRPADEAKPYAKYMKAHVDAPQQQVLDALANGPVPTAQVPTRRTLAAELQSPGYAPIETGYGKTASGEIWVACLTRMPRVRPEMWDWWFGWHSRESARYKLWHPDAHAYAGLKEDRSAQASLTDRQRFIGNVSYVDEVIGDHLDQLAIGFRDPGAFGVDASKVDGTIIAGTVGTVLAPVNIGLLFHEVRRVPGGSEMRSRFYLNVAGLRAFDTAAFACALQRGFSPPQGITFDTAFGAALMRHCGEEMNHLAQFLPELYAEFRGTP
ncbi:MAG: hypothetical protein PGN13_08775 [Patulibacter minatonensis]